MFNRNEGIRERLWMALIVFPVWFLAWLPTVVRENWNDWRAYRRDRRKGWPL